MDGMTIDEVIKYFDDDAKENEKLAIIYRGNDDDLAEMHKQDAIRSSYVSVWLRELKKLRNFTHFIARNVMEDDFEENGRFYTEVFCRRLNKLGVIRSENNKWIYDEEVKADERV